MENGTHINNALRNGPRRVNLARLSSLGWRECRVSVLYASCFVYIRLEDPVIFKTWLLVWAEQTRARKTTKSVAVQ